MNNEFARFSARIYDSLFLFSFVVSSSSYHFDRQVFENMRCNIYGLIQQLPMDEETVSQLDVDERVSLTAIEAYLQLKTPEILVEVTRELQLENVHPIEVRFSIIFDLVHLLLVVLTSDVIHD